MAVCTLPPLYRQVQSRYDEALQEERSNRDSRIASFSSQARETAEASASEAAQRRAAAEKVASDAISAAEERVRAAEEERRRMQEQHRLRLLAIHEAIEKNRSEADVRIEEVALETSFMHSDAYRQVERINAEREAAVRAARARCAEAERLGEERSRQAEQHEREVEAKSRKAIAEEEKKRARTALQSEKSSEIYLRHFEEATSEMQKRVSDRILELLKEARSVRELLAENRLRADAGFGDTVSKRRNDTLSGRRDAERELVRARGCLRQAEAAGSDSTELAGVVCEAQKKRWKEELVRCAKMVDDKVAGERFLETMANPKYIQGLEELARNLRAGKFRKPPPRAPELRAGGCHVERWTSLAVEPESA